MNQKKNQLKDKIQRQVDSYRAIDRFKPDRGPVCDRSSFYSINNKEEHCETVDNGKLENEQESHDQAIWNRSDDRAIYRSHERAINRSHKNIILER